MIPIDSILNIMNIDFTWIGNPEYLVCLLFIEYFDVLLNFKFVLNDCLLFAAAELSPDLLPHTFTHGWAFIESKNLLI